MIKKMLSQKSTLLAIAIFAMFSLGWVYVLYFVDPELMQKDVLGTTFDREDIFFGTYGLMALYGSILGITVSKKWGGYKSYVGLSILLFSLGLFAQVFGQVAYTIQGNILEEVPYPSVGDIGYFGSVIFYIYGAWVLAKATGFHITSKSLGNRLKILLIPAAILIWSYIAFLQKYEFDWSTPLVVFLDFGYPLGQAIYVSLALVVFTLSRKLLGGIMKPVIWLLIIALSVQYLADYTFLYSNHQGTWSVGGINDYTYLVAYFVMTLALIAFGSVAFSRHASSNDEMLDEGGDSNG